MTNTNRFKRDTANNMKQQKHTVFSKILSSEPFPSFKMYLSVEKIKLLQTVRFIKF